MVSEIKGKRKTTSLYSWACGPRCSLGFSGFLSSPNIRHQRRRVTPGKCSGGDASGGGGRSCRRRRVGLNLGVWRRTVAGAQGAQPLLSGVPRALQAPPSAVLAATCFSGETLNYGCLNVREEALRGEEMGDGCDSRDRTSLLHSTKVCWALRASRPRTGCCQQSQGDALCR